ncbi:hypothetical protein DU000_10330 [Parvibium lacunae]|uniref:Uncharacterized protein n=1 Tax=Parvibium lacunae TaxID=1888893 RepID=A0A368L0W4_9BURK|nr:hypothetical protein DU000_10330 [Parvibium lacunae]
MQISLGGRGVAKGDAFAVEVGSILGVSHEWAKATGNGNAKQGDAGVLPNLELPLPALGIGQFAQAG